MRKCLCVCVCVSVSFVFCLDLQKTPTPHLIILDLAALVYGFLCVYGRELGMCDVCGVSFIFILYVETPDSDDPLCPSPPPFSFPTPSHTHTHTQYYSSFTHVASVWTWPTSWSCDQQARDCVIKWENFSSQDAAGNYRFQHAVGDFSVFPGPLRSYSL